MTKKKIKELINEAIGMQQVANVHMVYNENYYNLIPLKTSEQLFLSANEDDFILDGYRISRFRDVKELRLKNDKCNEISRNEGILQELHTPEIDLASWQTVFEGLKHMGRNVIVQYETADGIDDEFTIGKIQKVYKNCLYMYHFDADGDWVTEPYRIPYSEVTSVTFDSRYVTVFSKYLEPAPAD